MGALSGLVDLSGRLEKAAETDERCEPAFVLVIEAAGRLLEGVQAGPGGDAVVAGCDGASQSCRVTAAFAGGCRRQRGGAGGRRGGWVAHF